MFLRTYYGIYFLILAFLINYSLKVHTLSLTAEQKQELGKKIWQNESAGTLEGLTFWKKGEDWASVGIGHFIWYPKTDHKKYAEGFPLLIKFMKEKKIKIPRWLLNTQGTLKPCPWSTRDEFMRNLSCSKMNELRNFLNQTVAVQADFISQRLNWSLPKIIAAADQERKEHIKQQYARLIKIAQGVYALVDYLNCKGEGIGVTENYNGVRWGLLQVLDRMQGEEIEPDPLEDFAAAAKKVLARRVDNSPPKRNERQWLLGWYNRIDTYRLRV
jgi:hypothetical protein